MSFDAKTCVPSTVTMLTLSWLGAKRSPSPPRTALRRLGGFSLALLRARSPSHAAVAAAVAHSRRDCTSTAAMVRQNVSMVEGATPCPHSRGLTASRCKQDKLLEQGSCSFGLIFFFAREFQTNGAVVQTVSHSQSQVSDVLQARRTRGTPRAARRSTARAARSRDTRGRSSAAGHAGMTWR